MKTENTAITTGHKHILTDAIKDSAYDREMEIDPRDIYDLIQGYTIVDTDIYDADDDSAAMLELILQKPNSGRLFILNIYNFDADDNGIKFLGAFCENPNVNERDI